MAKKPTSFRLSEETQELLGEIAERRGVTKTAILESLIRQESMRADLVDASNRITPEFIRDVWERIDVLLKGDLSDRSEKLRRYYDAQKKAGKLESDEGG